MVDRAIQLNEPEGPAGRGIAGDTEDPFYPGWCAGLHGFEDLPFELAGKIYCFKENYLKLVGKNPFTANIRDYSSGVVDYLNNTFPYCFALGGQVENFYTLDDALLFYAKSRGATSEQLEQIIPMLREIKLPQIETDSFEVSVVNESKELVSVDKICGSSIKRYKADNLYDALIAIDDKNVQSFINYLVVNENGILEKNNSIVY